MNRGDVDRIADAVLFEGYILYPYRPCVKNRQRWTFGGLFPEPYCQARKSGDVSLNQTECLVRGNRTTTSFGATVRFLHLIRRQAAELDPPLARWLPDPEPAYRPVEMLRVGDRLFPTWQEAEERRVILGEMALGNLVERPRTLAFCFGGTRKLEPIAGPSGDVHGLFVRTQERLEGELVVQAAPVADTLFRITLRVSNRALLQAGNETTRDEAAMHSLIATHAILEVQQGEFVSLLDPPECWRAAAAGCDNRGVWPVLAGSEGQKNLMLSAPIILYDYPQVAPESPGDFFDGAEIDEMLTLRIMTMTDEEKHLMAAVDERARALLQRTEASAGEQLPALHGTIRGLRPAAEETRDD